MDYTDKYIKYKTLYLQINQQLGGKHINEKKIIFVRHGESTENIATITGKSYDKDKIVLTKLGEEQAKITGEYLYKTFGKFDKVYTSPVTRCVQTADIIINQIDYKKKLEIDNLLVEIGYESNILDGLSKEEKIKIFDNIKLTLPKDNFYTGIKTFRQLEEKLNKTNNPFDKLKITKNWSNIEKIHLNIKPNKQQVKNNLKKFLKYLTKSNDENILVISHGGCISTVQKMICNIDINNIHISFTPTEINNCSIACISLKNNKYSLVSSANSSHLKNKTQ